MTTYTTTMQSPLGVLTLAASDEALMGVWFDTPPQAHWVLSDEHPVLRQAQQALSEYFAGQRLEFDVPLQPQGTAFQRAVWAQLLTVGYGATSTYGALAAAIGKPQAARAVGAAVGANPLSIIVPCHRIIGRDGSLTGYAWGVERKVALLELEQQREFTLTSACLAPKPAPIPNPRPAVHSSRSACAPAH